MSNDLTLNFQYLKMKKNFWLLNKKLSYLCKKQVAYHTHNLITLPIISAQKNGHPEFGVKKGCLKAAFFAT